jgi:hypothetical protein
VVEPERLPERLAPDRDAGRRQAAGVPAVGIAEKRRVAGRGQPQGQEGARQLALDVDGFPEARSVRSGEAERVVFHSREDTRAPRRPSSDQPRRRLAGSDGISRIG